MLIEWHWVNLMLLNVTNYKVFVVWPVLERCNLNVLLRPKRFRKMILIFKEWKKLYSRWYPPQLESICHRHLQSHPWSKSLIDFSAKSRETWSVLTKEPCGLFRRKSTTLSPTVIYFTFFPLESKMTFPIIMKGEVSQVFVGYWVLDC